MNLISKLCVVSCMALFGASAHAEDMLKPYVLASKGPGNAAEKVAAAKAALTANGFTVAGTYTPYAGTTIIAVTNDELKSTAAKSEMGGFGAAQRVAVVQAGGDVQVSYTNPQYMANAYRMKSDLKGVAAKLGAALGDAGEFGSASGLAAGKLRKYHYMAMMPYFDDPIDLAKYDSYEAAVKAVEANLAAGAGGTSKVYRIDIPGKKETVFGVGMKALDAKYMATIDKEEVKYAAHLPYEMLVSDNKVYMLHAKFRIAQSFPDLTMVTFGKITFIPGAIEDALTKAAGE